MPVEIAAPGTASRSRAPALLLVLVLLLSVFVQLTTLTRTVVASPLGPDARDYFAYTWNLHEQGVYSQAERWANPALALTPDKMRPPGYPLLLLTLGKPQPNQDWTFRVGLLQALLSVGSVLLTFLLARRVLSPGLAVAAAAVVAIDPYIANVAVYVLSETPFTFLMLAATLLSLHALRPGSHRGWALAAGLCWGAASLVRPTVQFLPPLLLAGALLLPAWRQWRGAALAGCLGFALAMAPWLLRNLSVPPPPPGKSLMINSLVHGSYPDFMYHGEPRSLGYPYRLDPQLNEKVRSVRSALSHIGAEAAAEPLRYARWYLLGKPYFFLSLRDVQSEGIQIYALAHTPWFEDRRFVALAAASTALHWPLMLAALAAIGVLAWRPRWLRLTPEATLAAAFVAIVVLYAIVLHMITAPFPRYAIPFRPLIFVLGFAALQAAWRAARRREAALADAAPMHDAPR